MAGKANLSRRIQEQRKRRLKRLGRKSESGLLPSGDFQFGPPGAEKMSTVLEEFVKPFLADTEDFEDIRGLYGLAVAAWNTALLPLEKQQAELDASISRMRPESAAAIRAHRDLLNQLIRRKQKDFASNRRAIIGFEVYRTGKHYQINVVSTLD